MILFSPLKIVGKAYWINYNIAKIRAYIFNISAEAGGMQPKFGSLPILILISD